MTIDRSKLRADVKRLSKSGEALRPAQVTAVVRELLPEIERMRSEDKATWRVIAEALASQGISEGLDKRPLSERRLTSIVTKLRARQKAEAGKLKARGGRPDIVSSREMVGQAASSTNKPRARLAPELTREADPPDDGPPLTEADILAAQFAKHAHLTKKD